MKKSASFFIFIVIALICMSCRYWTGTAEPEENVNSTGSGLYFSASYVYGYLNPVLITVRDEDRKNDSHITVQITSDSDASGFALTLVGDGLGSFSGYLIIDTINASDSGLRRIYCSSGNVYVNYEDENPSAIISGVIGVMGGGYNIGTIEVDTPSVSGFPQTVNVTVVDADLIGQTTITIHVASATFDPSGTTITLTGTGNGTFTGSFDVLYQETQYGIGIGATNIDTVTVTYTDALPANSISVDISVNNM